MDDPRITPEANDPATPRRDDPRITPETNAAPVPRRPDYYDRASSRPRFGRAALQKERDHLNLLSIFYFIFCGLECFGILFGVLYIVLGIVFLASSAAGPGGPGGTGGPGGAPPAELGYIMIAAGVFMLLLTGTFATCLGLTGNYLRKRKKRMFCFVIACIICLSFPFGTILGIFTILALQRDSVKELFEYGDQPPTGRGGRDDPYDDEM